MLLGTRIRRVLLMLDACYVGQGGNQLTASALERLGPTWSRSPGSGLVIMSSALPHQRALAGLFPTLLEDAVNGPEVAGHGPGTLSVNAIVQHMNGSGKRPGHQRISLNMVGLDGEAPAFFPNPRHDVRLNAIDLAAQQEAALDEQDRRRETELVTRLLVRAMGYQEAPGDAATEPGWWFSGRHAALTDLAAWLSTPEGGSTAACRVVTAGPGSGKTAVLGLIATLSHPERRRTVPSHALRLPADLVGAGAVDAAIYAQRLSDTDVLDALAAAARTRATTVGELLDALDHRPRPLTVLIDALDEAATPDTLCADLLRPLIQGSRGRIRLLLGTRPYLLPRLDVTDRQIVDLDSERWADPQALTAYTVRTLMEARRTSPYRDLPDAARPVAQAVARAAGNSFLIARITAGTLAAAPAIPDPTDPHWRASLPRHAGDAMREDLRQRLGPHAQRATDLLRPLAWAQGQGLPWEDLWAPLATAISGRPYIDDDIVWLRKQAGSYVVEATENGRSAYRLYHEAMAEHLRDGVDPEAVHAACTRVLADCVPYSADATRDWSRSHPYAVAHRAHHAARAGMLDHILADAEYLVHAHPRGLTPHLHQARSEAALLTAAVYRTRIHLHHNAAPQQRRQILALDAARAGAHDLHRVLVRRIPPDEWAPRWATGSTFDPALRDVLTGHRYTVDAVACTVLDGRPVAVTGGGDGTVRIWDLADGRPVGEPLIGHTGAVKAVACTVLDGHTVAITSAGEKTMRIWDLANGEPVGTPLTGHTDSGRGHIVNAVACTRLNGRPIAVTGGDDYTVRVRDLTTGRPLGEPLTGHTEPVDAVACTVLDGRPVAVTGGGDGTVRIWDLADGRPVGEPLIGHTGAVEAVACTVLDGRPIAVTGGREEAVRIWDLDTVQPVGRPAAGHVSHVKASVCTRLDGRPVAVTGSVDGRIRIWDLDTGAPLSRPLKAHFGGVSTVACTQLDGRPVVVSAGNDQSMQVWDLGTRECIPQPLDWTISRVCSLACTQVDGRPVAVIGGWDGTVRVWDLDAQSAVGRPLTGHTAAVHAVSCAQLDGHTVAVTAGHDATLRVWDLGTGRPFRRSGGFVRRPHIGAVTAMTCMALDGRLLVVTAHRDTAESVWDLSTGRPRHLGQLSSGRAAAGYAVACTMLDGEPVAVTSGGDNAVRVWDLHRLTPIMAVSVNSPRAVSISSSGDIVIGFGSDIALYRRPGHDRTEPPRPAGLVRMRD
ncbi:hypothetical protein AMK19_10235 [Kitasatospora sp. CB01950]|nr:hypothetical protein AMK19_10235 [Kitasatospora sp. CB01950]